MLTKKTRYAPFYCEENIWYLCRDDRFRGCEAIVAIISGHGSHRRLWFQRQAESPESPVLWDYHVVLLVFQEGWWVWDCDSTLDFPVSAEIYFSKTFLRPGVDVERVDVVLRLIEAEAYVRSFSSDRSHMKSPDGRWIAPPPPWPPIMKERRSTLLAWLDVGRQSPGKVLTLAEFMRDFMSWDQPTT